MGKWDEGVDSRVWRRGRGWGGSKKQQRTEEEEPDIVEQTPRQEKKTQDKKRRRRNQQEGRRAEGREVAGTDTERKLGAVRLFRPSSAHTQWPCTALPAPPPGPTLSSCSESHSRSPGDP